MSNEVIPLSDSFLDKFPLEHFRPVFYTGTYGCEVYYHLKSEVDIHAYAAAFRKSSDWVWNERQEPTFFFQKKNIKNQM